MRLKLRDEVRHGLDECDFAQLREVQVVNHLHDAIGAGAAAPALRQIIEALVEGTKKRFAQEIEAMRKAMYPGRNAHANDHYRVLRAMGDLWASTDFENGATNAVAEETMEAVAKLMRRHMFVEDMLFKAFLSGAKL